MKKIKFFLRNHFGFSQRETNGFIILVFLMFATLFLPSLVKYFYNPALTDTSVKDQQLLDSILHSMTEVREEVEVKRTYESKSSFSISPADFDPNTASDSDLEKIVGKRVASTIVKFRSKGGKFKVKQDLKKIYGVDEKTYEALKSYILLPDSIINEKKTFQTSAENKKVVIDINLADTTDLEKLNGIGKILAGRIIRFRDKLGGFVSQDQLAAIYGLSPEIIAELKERTFISPGFIPEKINLNTVSQNKLQTHPFFGKKIAMLIVNYREQHGKFSSCEQLSELKGISSEELHKFLPYVSCQ